MDVRFVYSPYLSEYQLSPDHPFKPIRLELTRSLLQATGLLRPEHETGFKGLSDQQLLAVHDEAYVELVKAVSRGERLTEAYAYGLGTGDNPIFKDMHAAILRVCAATVTAVDLVASGKAQRALNIAGGLHHALRDRASGFCVYNDLAVAIEHACKRYGLRVAYVDVDAHHGDGVQWLFYERSEVMTISLHESGRYLFPGTGHTFEVGKGAGRGLSVNVPLEPFTEDASFLEAFEAVVPRALRLFKPDLIVLQAGADMHRYDPLADLALSTHAIAESYRRMVELANELCEGRLVATGGGGYDAYRTVPRAWALLWAALSEQTMPERLPEAWRARWQPQSPIPLPETLHDDVSQWEPIPRRKEIESQNRAVVRRLFDALEPIWQQRFSVKGS
jgi:acetoin utilization protein AcuC